MGYLGKVFFVKRQARKGEGEGRKKEEEPV